MSETNSRLEEIRERMNATPSGPWWWGGHVDGFSDVSLRALDPQFGVVDVLRNTPEDIDEEIAEAEWNNTDARDYMGKEEYILWRTQNPKNYLAAMVPKDMFVEILKEKAVFEVARNRNLPDDTPRSHPKIYRDDVVDVRNPQAQFIAHSRADIEFLLGEIERLQKIIDSK